MNSIDFIKAPFVKVVENFSLLKGASLTEVQQRYAGSMAGLAWVVIYPVLLFCIYSSLYVFIFRIRPNDMTTNMYVIYIMSGLLPFLGFAESLSTGTTSLSNKKNLLLNTVYPSEFIPLQAVISSHMTLISGIFLLLAAQLFVMHKIFLTVLVVPYLILLQIMFASGLVWILSILNLLIKDIQQSLSFVTMLIMIMSPIAYTPSMVPKALKLVIYLNPFSYFVWSYQDIFVNGALSIHLIIATLISVSFFLVGHLFYNKTKKVFYEFA